MCDGYNYPYLLVCRGNRLRQSPFRLIWRGKLVPPRVRARARLRAVFPDGYRVNTKNRAESAASVLSHSRTRGGTAFLAESAEDYWFSTPGSPPLHGADWKNRDALCRVA